jgi:hypothetical protein
VTNDFIGLLLLMAAFCSLLHLAGFASFEFWDDNSELDFLNPKFDAAGHLWKHWLCKNSGLSNGSRSAGIEFWVLACICGAILIQKESAGWVGLKIVMA